MDGERDDVPFEAFFNEDFSGAGLIDEFVDDIDAVDDEG